MGSQGQESAPRGARATPEGREQLDPDADAGALRTCPTHRNRVYQASATLSSDSTAQHHQMGDKKTRIVTSLVWLTAALELSIVTNRMASKSDNSRVMSGANTATVFPAMVV